MSEQTDAYKQIIDELIANYSGADTQYQKIDDAASSPCDVNQIVNNMPNMTLVRDNGGNVIGYDYKYTGPKSIDTTDMEVDSNSGGSSFGTATGGGGTTRGGGTGRYVGHFDSSNGFQAATDNNGNPLVSAFVDPVWAAVSTAAKFGKNINDDAFDFMHSVGDHAAEAYHDLMMQTADNGAAFIRALFGVDNQGNTTMYVDEDTIGAYALQLKDDGTFDTGDSTASIDPAIYNPPWAIDPPPPFIVVPYQDIRFATNGGNYNFSITLNSGSIDYIIAFRQTSNLFYFRFIYFSRVPFTLNYNYHTKTPPYPITYTEVLSYNVSGTQISHITTYVRGSSFNGVVLDHEFTSIPSFNMFSRSGFDSTLYPQLSTLLYDGTISGGQAVPGVSDQAGATSPVDAITGADPHVVAQNLATQYPQVMGDPIQIVVLDDSCNEVTKKYYSVPISYSPTTINAGVPITGGLQINPSFNPDVQLDLPDIDMSKYTEQIINQLQGSGAGVIVNINPDTGDPETLDPEPPNTGEGVTPPEVLPEAQVTAMWHIYNPSSSELSSFGSWMWEQTIIDQIIRLFNNPMEAVIGLHAVFVEPHVSSPNPIVVGNIASRVSSNIVTKQYKSLNCGSVWLTEYFGNVFDYAPYTKVKLYLPFVGIVDLNVADVMRGEITVQYMVDVYTGACTATVSVSRDGVGGVLYQYSGNCAVEYPVSGASYSRMWQALASTVAVGLGGVASGNIAGAAGSMVATAMSAKVDVAHSGSFSGNPGAMGIKKPYLIITRPQTNMAIDFERYDGRGSNYTSRVGDCSGYIKCKEVHLNVPGAYKDELDEIEELLKEGILI